MMKKSSFDDPLSFVKPALLGGGRLFNRVSLFLALLLSLLPAMPCENSALAAGEPIRVVYGFDREFPPFSYEEPGGKAVGFEVELIKAIFEGTNVNLFFRPLQWERVELELAAGTVQVTTGMVRTDYRAKMFLFSELPSFPLQIRFFTKVYNRFPSASLLRGQMVSVEQGSFQHRLLEAYGGVNIKTYPNRIAGLRALYNDEVVAFCGPMQNTYYYINKLNYGAITTMGTPLGITDMRIAVNRDRGDIQRMVNEGLQRVIASGDYDLMWRKYFVRELTDKERGRMLEAARKAAIPAYVPYGQSGQGAAVLTATDKIFTACTVENADFPLSLSALRSAVARAIAEGEFELRAAVIVTPDGAVVPPSAEELQTLYEFGRGILTIQEAAKGVYKASMVSQILSNPVIRDTTQVAHE